MLDTIFNLLSHAVSSLYAFFSNIPTYITYILTFGSILPDYVAYFMYAGILSGVVIKLLLNRG